MWKKIKTYVRHGVGAVTGGIGGLITSVLGGDTPTPEGAVEFGQEPTVAIATAVAIFVYAATEKFLKRFSIFHEEDDN